MVARTSGSAVEAAIKLALDASPPPSGPDTKPFLFLTVGLPGSGKTTFSRRLAAATGAAVLESDFLRVRFFKSPRHTPAESRFLFGLIQAAAELLIASGRPVIVDATSLRESERRPLYKVADGGGVPLYISTFAAPLHVIEERLRRRRQGLGVNDYSQAGSEVYHRMEGRFQVPSRPHWWVDSGDHESPAAVMAEVLAAIAGSGSNAAVEGVRARPERD